MSKPGHVSTVKLILTSAGILATAFILCVVASWLLKWRPFHKEVTHYTPSLELQIKHQQLYQGLDALRTLLDRARIPWWPIAGTLLGMARHGALIPWDDDIDLAIWSRDLGRVKHILMREKWAHFSFGTHITIFFQDVHIDIIGCTLSPQGHVVYDNTYWQWMFPREYFDHPEDVRIEKDVKFGSTTCPCPSEDVVCTFLDRAYPGWRTLAVIQQGHDFTRPWEMIKGLFTRTTMPLEGHAHLCQTTPTPTQTPKPSSS